uniref:BRCT domain-containing protein n=1 Tax=Parascaris univalens TaxID=6257 RepID=A0A915AGH6_PARUN
MRAMALLVFYQFALLLLREFSKFQTKKYSAAVGQHFSQHYSHFSHSESICDEHF